MIDIHACSLCCSSFGSCIVDCLCISFLIRIGPCPHLFLSIFLSLNYWLQSRCSYNSFFGLRGLGGGCGGAISLVPSSGFVQVLENLESPGFLLQHFPGLKSPGKRLMVLESSGNLFN